jgi:hypothetical protein
MMSSKLRGRSSSSGARRERSSRTTQQFGAGFAGGLPFVWRCGVETGGPDDGAGEGNALAEGVGVAAGAAGGLADGGDAAVAERDGIGAGGVGGVSLDGQICPNKELSDDATLSTPFRTVETTL